ncbi:MAG: putative xylanase/chitin deacetylase [Capsulimonas sp.]|jgi:peptidoglycan/xylan/chitin deacetylase (PgdA/CDA1 family)|nr:putative xylanase/chitin deacetylase [Capsulimonas sp.]
MKRLGPVAPIVAVLSVAGTLLTFLALRLFNLPASGAPYHWVGLCVTLLLTTCFLFIFIAPWRWGLPILTHLPIHNNQVALTFDDGPSPDITPRILDVLASAGAHATFFVLGEQARRHPDLIRRIAAEGHTLALHGDTHRAMVLISTSAIRREIQSTQEAITAASPEIPTSTLLRPPYGFKSPMLLIAARSLGVHLTTWSLDPADYLRHDPAKIAAAVLSRVKPGDIILLHDGAGRTATADALPAILACLQDRGFQCVGLRDGDIG